MEGRNGIRGSGTNKVSEFEQSRSRTSGSIEDWVERDTEMSGWVTARGPEKRAHEISMSFQDNFQDLIALEKKGPSRRLTEL